MTYLCVDRDVKLYSLTHCIAWCCSDPNQSPGERSLGEWPLHTPTSREYIELNSRFLAQRDKSRAVGRGPRLAECAFWDIYLPQLVDRTGPPLPPPHHFRFLKADTH